MAETIGKVLDKAKTDSFQFVSKKPFKAKFVEVKIDHISNNARIIGEITEKESINPYFERPADIRYVKDKDEGVNVRSLYVSKVDILTLINNGERTEVSFPPLPGSNVFEAKEADIRLALDLKESGMDIGNLTGYKLALKLSYNKLVRTHISIVGQTGSGKSYLAAKIALELIKLRRYAELPVNIPIPIIFDTSGEYSVDYTIATQHSDLALIFGSLAIGEHHFPLLNERYLWLLNEIYNIKYKQESELSKWIRGRTEIELEVDAGGQSQVNIFKEWDSGKLIEEFSQLRISSTKQLANKLEEYFLRNNKQNPNEQISVPYDVFSKMRRYNLKIKKTDDLDIIDNLSNGLIIDLSRQDDLTERQIVMKLFLAQLLEAGKSRRLKSKVVLFIDEAHNYVPSVYKSFCKEEILRIAREGRKYGFTLCLISQRPRWVDPTALSQCGNIFIFRIQNSEDKRHIFDSASLPDSVKNTNIARLGTGEMIIAGDVAENPINCVVSEIDKDFISSERKRIKDKHMKVIKKALEKN